MNYTKLIFSAVLIFFLIKHSFSQDYTPFYMNDAEWTMERLIPGFGGRNQYSYWKIYTLNDTLINGKNYRIIATKNLCELFPASGGGHNLNTSIDTNQYLLGGIREEDKKIYFFRFDEKPQWRILQYYMNGLLENQEHLIYDFDISLGDTTHYSDQSLFTVTNGDTSFITVKSFSVFRKVAFPDQEHNRYSIANSCAFAFPFEENYTIEGIGSSYGFFGAYDCFLTYLKCFRLNGTPLIFDYQCDPCAGYTPTEDKNESVDLIIYPNPAGEKVNVIGHSSNKIKEIQILNSLGQLLRSNHYSSDQIQIDLSDIPTGIVFLKIKLEDGEQEKRKLIVN